MTGRGCGFEHGRRHLGRARPRGLTLLAGRVVAVAVALAGGLAIGPRAVAQQAADAAPAQRAIVRWKEILTEGDVTRVRLETSSLPRYRVSSTAEPPAAEVELFDVELEGLPPRVEVRDGTIEAVETVALPGGGGRLSFRLAGPGDAQVVPWGGGLDVLVHLAAAPTDASAPAPEGARVVRRTTSPEGLAFVLGGTPANLSAFVLSDGKRLVVDAEGVEIPAPQLVQEFPEGPFQRVRMARQDGRVRAVVEARAAGAFDGHQLEKSADGFALRLAAAPVASKQPSEPAVAAEGPKPAAAAAVTEARTAKAAEPEPEPRGGGSVLDLGFRQEGGKSLVEIVVSKSAPHVVRQATPQRVVLDLLRTALPEKFRRALDTTSFPGPVRLIAAYPRGGGRKPFDTRVVVDLRRPSPYRIERQGGRVSLVFEGGAPEPAVPGVAEVRRGQDEVVVVEGKPRAPAPEKPDQAGRPGGGAAAAPAGYAGRKLSMDFMDADIRNVLRLIGEVSGLNMVSGDDVQGKVTIRLVDVPWDQALDVILKTKGLGQAREGNVVRIAPADKLAAEKARVLESERGVEEKAPLVSDILPVNYASAKEVMDKVKAVLSPRGSVAVDDRTNALLVKDTAEKIQEAKVLIARLDTPTPQVLIEARIVEVSSTYSRDLGVQWGGKFTADAAHGNATNWAFPNSVGVAGSAGDGNLAVNFPAAIGTSAGGALSLSLGHINDVLGLDLRLSALESSGHGRIVSSPRVATLDNRTAEIAQGVEIPFTTATEEKIETQSISYLLKLNVTPHVTSDRSVSMKIAVTKDAPSTTFFAVDSRTPAKETRSATTEVLVRDGETTVIGGIITDTQRDSEAGVPFFSKIPFLGALFKRKSGGTDKTELIIFITPKIVASTAVAGSR